MNLRDVEGKIKRRAKHKKRMKEEARARKRQEKEDAKAQMAYARRIREIRLAEAAREKSERRRMNSFTERTYDSREGRRPIHPNNGR